GPAPCETGTVPCGSDRLCPKSWRCLRQAQPSPALAPGRRECRCSAFDPNVSFLHASGMMKNPPRIETRDRPVLQGGFMKPQYLIYLILCLLGTNFLRTAWGTDAPPKLDDVPELSGERTPFSPTLPEVEPVAALNLRSASFDRLPDLDRKRPRPGAVP